MSYDFFFGHGGKRQTPETAPADGDWSTVEQYWIGRSCGCKLRTLDDKEVVNTSGIVVYPGKKFRKGVTEKQRLDHVSTKNGVLTIVSALVHK